MKPVSPVLKGIQEVIYKSEDKDVQPLPALKGSNGMVVSRWKMGLLERLQVLFTGSVYLFIQTHNEPLQPQLVTVCKPTVREE